MIEAGTWPGTRAAVMAQSEFPIVPNDVVSAVIPGEERIYFFSPPFLTAQQASEGGEEYPIGPDDTSIPDLGQLLVIGDFGLGSESSLLLDYSQPDSKPRVARLVSFAVPDGYDNQYSILAESFAEFCQLVGLQ